MNNSKTTFGFVVSGKVQGVGFRWSTRNKARQLGLGGWVRNCADGRVEGEVSGNSGDVDLFLDWLAVGPPGGRVDALNTSQRGEWVDHQRFDIVS